MTRANVGVYINPKILCSQFSDTLPAFHANALLFFEANGQNGFLPEQPA